MGFNRMKYHINRCWAFYVRWYKTCEDACIKNYDRRAAVEHEVAILSSRGRLGAALVQNGKPVASFGTKTVTECQSRYINI